MDMAALRNEVATLCAETESVEFKSRFDYNTLQDRVEVVKDIVAMHNSGGGAIIFGLDSGGGDAGEGAGLVRDVDTAELTDMVRKYVGRDIGGLRIERFEKHGKAYAGWIISPADVPVPFKFEGAWEKPDKKPKRVFSEGQVYFRHGARSAPAVYEDFLHWKERIAEAARRKMHADMGPLITMKDADQVHVVSAVPAARPGDAGEQVRITNDPRAKLAAVIDPFKVHRHRQKDVIPLIAAKVPGGVFNQHDVKCVNWLYRSEIEAKGLVYVPPHSAPYYSDGFVEWIGEKIGEDPQFLSKARDRCRENGHHKAKVA